MWLLGGMRGCWGACMVAGEVCMVAGGVCGCQGGVHGCRGCAWLLGDVRGEGGVCGKGGHAWRKGGAWRRGGGGVATSTIDDCSFLSKVTVLTLWFGERCKLH